MPSDKLIFVASVPKKILNLLGIQQEEIKIYRSKGLLAHLIKRKHFVAATKT